MDRCRRLPGEPWLPRRRARLHSPLAAISGNILAICEAPVEAKDEANAGAKFEAKYEVHFEENAEANAEAHAEAKDEAQFLGLRQHICGTFWRSPWLHSPLVLAA